LGLEVRPADGRFLVARGEQRRFVDQIREIRTGEPGGPRRNDLQIYIWRELDRFGMDAQNLFAAFDVRLVDQHLSIEAAGTKQRRVEHLGPVGRGHDDDALARVETVHLREQLIERLLALFVAADWTLHARLAQRIELVDEDDARRLRFRLLKEIADARSADADEHLDEL